MARFLTLLACIAFVAAASALEIQNIDAVELVNDIEAFRVKNPDIELIPLSQQEEALGRIRYTLGSRIQGDRLVAHGSNTFTYSTPRDVQVRLSYPQSGTGAVITFVEIWVDQSSNSGRAYIASGGIGQRSIVVIVEAKQTLYFSYSASFYGY